MSLVIDKEKFDKLVLSWKKGTILQSQGDFGDWDSSRVKFSRGNKILVLSDPEIRFTYKLPGSSEELSAGPEGYYSFNVLNITREQTRHLRWARSGWNISKYLIELTEES